MFLRAESSGASGLVCWSTQPLVTSFIAVGPSIHATSRIQHAAPVFAGQNFVVSGKRVDAYERRGRHYIVLDVELRGDEGACLVQIRHTSVFHVAKSG